MVKDKLKKDIKEMNERFDTDKSKIHSIRAKVHDMLAGSRNIDRLLTDKVEDYILLDEQPLAINIGNKIMFVGNFTLNNDNNFWGQYGKLLALIGVKFINFDLLENSGELYKTLKIHKKFSNALIKLIGKILCKQQAYYLNDQKVREKIKWVNFSVRYFKKHITYEKLLQICSLIYLHNYDAEKKNWQIIMGWMAKEPGERRNMEIYMYYWLQNLGGISGKFQLALLTNTDYWYDESLRETLGLKANKSGAVRAVKDNKNSDMKELNNEKISGK